MRIEALVLFFAMLCSACSLTISAVNPRPNVVVTARVGAVAVDASKIADIQEPKVADPMDSHVFFKDFRTTLVNGFRNAVGSHYAAVEQPAPMRLVFDMVDMGYSSMGSHGRFLTVRYQAHWTDASGQTLAEMAGIAQPRNPLAEFRRELEDVVEVMYEKVIDGLDKAFQTQAAVSAPRG